MHIFSVVLILISLGSWLFFLIQPSRKLKKLGVLFPGPKPAPFLGNVLSIGINSKHFSRSLWKIADQYGSVFRLFLGRDLFIFVSNPEDIKTIMVESKQVEKRKNSTMASKAWLGNGLLMATTGVWKMNRKRLVPAFHTKIVENYIPVFKKNAQVFIEELETFVNGPEVDITKASAMFALRNVCETTMGVSPDSLSNIHLYPEIIQNLTQILATKISVPFLENRLVYNFLPIGRKEKRLLQYVDTVTEKIITARKKDNKIWEHPETQNEDAEGSKERLIFLDLLLSIQREDPSFSDQQIRDEINSIIFAGHDATTATLSFCLYLLSTSREVQDKVYEETNRILNGDDRSLEWQDLQEMRYLEQVIQETLRIYTSVPIIGRRADSDIKLKSGLVIPAGAEITLWLHRMHNDPELYPNPKVFNPENFSPENVKQRHAYSFMPFGAGPRDCLGRKFAYNEIKIAVSTLVRNFILLPSNSQKELRLVSEMVLKTDSGLHMNIQRR